MKAAVMASVSNGLTRHNQQKYNKDGHTRIPIPKLKVETNPQARQNTSQLIER